jgi:hypothetical protein
VPLRGETIGTAYIRVLADGSGLDRSVKKELEDAEASFHEGGEESSKAFDEGFNAQQKKDRNIEKGLVRSLDRAFGKMEADERLFAKGFGERLGARISDGLRQSFPALQDSAEELGERMSKAILSDFAESGTFNIDLRRRLKSALAEMKGAEDEFERDWRRTFDEINRDTDKVFAGIDKDFDNARKTFRRMGQDVEKLGQIIGRDGAKALVEFGEEADKTSKKLEETNKRTKSYADTIGKVFGKGGRNDFINFFGSFVSLPLKAAESMGKLTKSVIGFVDEFKNADDKMKFLTDSLGTFIKSVPGFVIVVGTLVGSLSVVSSLISGITGLILALAGSLAFALVGAIGAVVGALGVLAIAAGVAVGALVSLSDAQKKALAPVTNAFKGLGKVAADALGPHLVKNADAFAEAIRKLRPLVRGVAEAIGHIADGFAKAVSGPGYQHFVDVLTKKTPSMVELLGKSLQNVLAGAGGVFESLLPITRRFLHWLEEITGKFAEWANSDEGQKKLKDFFDSAAESAKKVGDFLGTAAEALGRLLGEGKGTGDKLFQDMADAMQRFVDYLTDPKNKDSIDDFFKFAQDLGESLGKFGEAVIKMFDALDTPETRELLLWIIKAFTWILEKVTWVIEKFMELAHWMRTLKKQFDDLDISDLFSGAGKVVAKFIGFFAGLGGKIIAKIGDIDIMDKIKKVDIGKIVGWFVGLPGKILAAINPFGVDGKIKKPNLNTIAQMFAPLGGVGGLIYTAINVIDITNKIVHSDSQIAASFGGLANSIANAIGTVFVPVKAAGRPSASGGVFFGPETRLIGEAGPEAVVPLARPLSQVDPAVRALSAFAQGLTVPGAGGVSTPAAAGMRPIELTVVTPTQDPFAVATETINRLTAVGYS